MKFFVAFTLIVAVASARYTKPIITAEQAEIQEIIAAIQSPSTNPATAAALEQMLLDLLGVNPDPVAVGPAIIEAEPVSVGPAIIDFPVPSEVAPVVPSPVLPGPAVVAPATPSAPLVQIILNIRQATAPEGSPAPVAVPEPVQIIDNWPVVAPAPVSPVEIVDVSPVQVVDTAPVAIEPVIIGTPVIPVPAVVLPEELN